jgi:trans-2,3-dihydro-3-hydroxyanthranilate isomerase
VGPVPEPKNFLVPALGLICFKEMDRTQYGRKDQPMKKAFYQVDVFTEHPLGGNPLAVFVEGEGLSDDLMLKVAREMNLSETTFLLPPSHPEADFDLRIFTPGKEIPFAGHPTIGTAHILWETGRIPPDQSTLVLKMGVGNIKVSRGERGLFMTQPPARFNQPYPSPVDVAQSISLPLSALNETFPIEEVSTGFPALLVPVKNIKNMQSLELNLPALKKILGDIDMIYVFTLETLQPDSTVHVRSFAPFIGITEDPATGSVAGAMAAYLVEHEIISEDQYSGIVIEQGFEMGRPSLIQGAVEKTEGKVTSIQVGGQSTTVIEGWLTL